MNIISNLQINPDRLIHYNELVTIRGGDFPVYSCCYCWDGVTNMGLMSAWGQEDCSSSCGIMDWEGSWGNC